MSDLSGASVAPRFKVGDQVRQCKAGTVDRAYEGLNSGTTIYVVAESDTAWFVAPESELSPLSAPSAPSPEEARPSDTLQVGQHARVQRDGIIERVQEGERGPIYHLRDDAGPFMAFSGDPYVAVVPLSADSRVVSPSAGARMNEAAARELIQRFEHAVMSAPHSNTWMLALHGARNTLFAALIGQPSTDTESR